MKGKQTAKNPPATLIGLGPPEPPRAFDERSDARDGADAPAETLRGWTTSAAPSVDTEPATDEPFVPLKPLFPRGILPFFGDRSAPPVKLFFIAAGLVTVGAVYSIGMSLVHRVSLRPDPVAAACRPATMSVVGIAAASPRPADMKRQPSSEPTKVLEREPASETADIERKPSEVTSTKRETSSEASLGEPSPPGKRIRKRSRHSPGSSLVSSSLGTPRSSESTTSSSGATDEARIEAIADGVRLEDDGASSGEREAARPERPAPAVP